MKGLRKCSEAVPSTQKKGHLYLVLDDPSFLKVTKEHQVMPTKPLTYPDLDEKDKVFINQQKI